MFPKIFFAVNALNLCDHLSDSYHFQGCYITFSALKYKDFSKFYQMFLLLSGNIRLNLAPAPNGVSHYSWKSFENKGPHFIHWNVISILSKGDELKTIAGNTKIAVIGEMESNFSTLCIQYWGWSLMLLHTSMQSEQKWGHSSLLYYGGFMF